MNGTYRVTIYWSDNRLAATHDAIDWKNENGVLLVTTDDKFRGERRAFIYPHDSFMYAEILLK